jgi:hypothetical protein
MLEYELATHATKAHMNAETFYGYLDARVLDQVPIQSPGHPGELTSELDLCFKKFEGIQGLLTNREIPVLWC